MTEKTKPGSRSAADQAPWWQCGECGHILQATAPPEQCPSCNRRCEFRNVTCYTPDCGPDGPDPKLLNRGS